MREADLTGARFDKATVRDVDLSGALLHRTSFHRRGPAWQRPVHPSTRSTPNVRAARIDYDQATVIAETIGFRIG